MPVKTVTQAVPQTDVPVPPMSAPTQQQAMQQVALLQDWATAKAHLLRVREQVMLHAGKEGCNPYMWCDQMLKPLEAAVAGQSTGTRNDELYDRVFSLALDVMPYVKDLRGSRA